MMKSEDICMEAKIQQTFVLHFQVTGRLPTELCWRPTTRHYEDCKNRGRKINNIAANDNPSEIHYVCRHAQSFFRPYMLAHFPYTPHTTTQCLSPLKWGETCVKLQRIISGFWCVPRKPAASGSRCGRLRCAAPNRFWKSIPNSSGFINS